MNGLEMEKLIRANFNLSNSSNSDDIFKDIDAWDGDDISISIKTQHTALRTGNLAFETHLVDAQGQTMDSWLYTGKSAEYWFVVGDIVYVYDAQKIKAWIDRNIKDLRSVKLTDPKRIAENVAQGRKYIQSSCILVSMKRIEHLVERELFL